MYIMCILNMQDKHKTENDENVIVRPHPQNFIICAPFLALSELDPALRN